MLVLPDIKIYLKSLQLKKSVVLAHEYINQQDRIENVEIALTAYKNVTYDKLSI